MPRIRVLVASALLALAALAVPAASHPETGRDSQLLADDMGWGVAPTGTTETVEDSSTTAASVTSDMGWG